MKLVYVVTVILAASPAFAAVDTSGFLRTREVCNARGYHLPPLTPAVAQWLRARSAEGVDVSRVRVDSLIGTYGVAVFCWYVDSQQPR